MTVIVRPISVGTNETGLVRPVPPGEYEEVKSSPEMKNTEKTTILVDGERFVLYRNYVSRQSQEQPCSKTSSQRS